MATHARKIGDQHCPAPDTQEPMHMISQWHDALLLEPEPEESIAPVRLCWPRNTQGPVPCGGGHMVTVREGVKERRGNQVRGLASSGLKE